MPKVTVIMPTYNVAPWVSEAVDSVLNQTYKDFELLVMDDCSSDETVNIVRAIDDSRIRIEINEHNLGLAENLNRGLSLTKTEYVSRMDGDDIAEPTWLEKEVAVLDAHPEVGICSAGFQRFGTSNSLVRFSEKHEDALANMLFGCTVIVPTFRYSLYSELGLKYKTSAFPAEDYRFWAECLRQTKVYNIQETLFHYRMHPSQICTAKREIQQTKVSEVRRYMLEWLNPNMKEEDKLFFLNKFVKGDILSRSDWKKYKQFSQRLIEYNTVIGHFSRQSLEKRFEKHIVLSVYDTVTNKYYSQGYSMVSYFKYLFSGLAFKTTMKYEAKFLLKSILHRKF